MTLRRAFAGLAFLLLAAPAALHAQEPSVVVYVVRHAERAEDGTNDPPISAQGEARSRLVADMMRGARLTHIHTTDFLRTRSTVAPAAEATGLTPTVYDPRDLVGFADRLRATPGRHLVVGHSNTNPELVTALGGDGGGAIAEMEYDRAYAVVVMPSGAIGSATFRFGEASSGGDAPDGGAAVTPGTAPGGERSSPALRTRARSGPPGRP